MVERALDGEFELPLNHIAHGFTLMRDGIVLDAVRGNDMDVAFKQIARAKRHQALIVDTVAITDGVRRRNRPLPRPQDDAWRIRVGSKERLQVAAECMDDALEHR